MIARTRGYRPLVLIVLASCVPPPQATHTVELADPSSAVADVSASPAPAGAIDQAQTHESGGERAEAAKTVSGQGVASAEEGAGESDRAFVQSRTPRELTAEDVQALPIHLNDAWWPFRAKFLGMTESQARQRDAAISPGRAPREFWDQQTAAEAVSVWTVLCNECHGGRRSVEDALSMPPPAPGWGQHEGLFFGNRRSYRHVFDIVYHGGPEQDGVRSEMIAWKKELSREQIWSLLYFLEYQSGGIEGHFPPSLYPRRPEAIERD